MKMDYLFLSRVSGKLAPDDRVPTMVVVPYAAKMVLQELLNVAAEITHPQLLHCAFNVPTGARLLCSFVDTQRECVEAGMDLAEQGLDSLDGWDSEKLWTDANGKVYVPYLLSEPDREPMVIVGKNGEITLQWDAVDTNIGEQPLESDIFTLNDLTN